MMRDLYTQVIMDHYQRPRNKGELEGADIKVHLNNPLCGDEITVYAALKDGKIDDLKFSGRGCSISQASASMMTVCLKGKSLKEAGADISSFKAMLRSEGGMEDPGDLAALEGVKKYPARVKCATLAWVALEQGLKE